MVTILTMTTNQTTDGGQIHVNSVAVLLDPTSLLLDPTSLRLDPTSLLLDPTSLLLAYY